MADSARTVTATLHAAPSPGMRVDTGVKYSKWDPEPRWQKPLFCREGLFFKGIGQIQEFDTFDDKGLTYVVFSCSKSDGSTNGFLKSGLEPARWLSNTLFTDHVHSVDSCRGRMFITGVQVYFDQNRGAVRMKLVCSAPGRHDGPE